MSRASLIGGCLCGAVRYECGLPVAPGTFCHCESCRRAAGAHIVAWVTVPRDSFRLREGTLRGHASSPGVLRQFCERCGTPITYRNTQSADTIDVTIGSLDDPDAIEVADHIWMEDAASWDRPRDGLPLFRTTRAAGERFEE